MECIVITIVKKLISAFTKHYLKFKIELSQLISLINVWVSTRQKSSINRKCRSVNHGSSITKKKYDCIHHFIDLCINALRKVQGLKSNSEFSIKLIEYLQIYLKEFPQA